MVVQETLSDVFITDHKSEPDRERGLSATPLHGKTRLSLDTVRSHPEKTSTSTYDELYSLFPLWWTRSSDRVAEDARARQNGHMAQGVYVWITSWARSASSQ